MRALTTIRGVDIPAPSAYNGTTSTVVDDGRNVEGVWIGAVIREDMAKVEMTWRFITPENWSKIEKLFLSKFGGSFVNDVTFYNQTIADWETRKMYVSDRTTSGIFLRNKDGTIRGYENARLALIEV